MSKLTPPVGPGDHLLGDPDAPVTLVEYGDFECPYCARAHAAIQEVLRRLGGDVRFAFRHFPLAELHLRALPAAEAAEAAGAQGKLWPMHDLLFENQDALEPEDLVGYAEALGLDVARFTTELATHAHLDKVREDFRSGVRSGVHGTPTFFIDGARFDAPWEVETLTAAVQEAARAKAKAA